MGWNHQPDEDVFHITLWITVVKVDGATPLPKDGIKRRTFHCHLSMCEFIRRNLRFFGGGKGKTPLPNFETPGLSEVYPPLLPAEMATHRVPTLARLWGTWCDGIEGVMFIPTRDLGESLKRWVSCREPSARKSEGCPIHSGNYSWFVKSSIFVKRPDGSSCCKKSHNQMYCEKKSGQTYSNNTKPPTSPFVKPIFHGPLMFYS